jgi:hypothetical protein
VTFQWVHYRVSSSRKLLPARLTLEIQAYLFCPMHSTAHQCMAHFFGDPIIFAAFGWAKIPFGPYPLLRPPSPFPLLPGLWQFPLGNVMLSFRFATLLTVPLAFGSQNGWFARSLVSFLFSSSRRSQTFRTYRYNSYRRISILGFQAVPEPSALVLSFH